MTPTPSGAALREWHAADWIDLCNIWEGLVSPPESTDEFVPRFRGRELTPQEAGIVFERWVLEAFRLSEAHGHYPYHITQQDSERVREQIDGLVFDGWQGFLIESKHQAPRVDFEPIALLHALVGLRVIGTLGLFFSVSGFTAAARELVNAVKPLQVLLFDQEDLLWMLRVERRMPELVRRKWMLAIKYGRATMPVHEPLPLF